MKSMLNYVKISFFLALSLMWISGYAIAQNGKIKTIDFGEPENLVIFSEGNRHNFLVEVADTDEEQARGLMYRDNLAADAGMLFEFEKPKVATIWMKNTAIPLDILFVRSNGKILKIEHSATPYTLRSASSEGRVAAVVELVGGRAQELGIMPGDIVQHSFLTTWNKSKKLRR